MTLRYSEAKKSWPVCVCLCVCLIIVLIGPFKFLSCNNCRAAYTTLLRKTWLPLYCAALMILCDYTTACSGHCRPSHRTAVSFCPAKPVLLHCWEFLQTVKTNLKMTHISSARSWNDLTGVYITHSTLWARCGKGVKFQLHFSELGSACANQMNYLAPLHLGKNIAPKSIANLSHCWLIETYFQLDEITCI